MICGNLFLPRTNGFGKMVPIYAINAEIIPTVTERSDFQEDAMHPSVGWIPKKKMLCGCLVELGMQLVLVRPST